MAARKYNNYAAKPHLNGNGAAKAITYSLFEQIIDRIEHQAVSLRVICADVGVDYVSFMRAKDANEEWCNRYLKAKQVQCDTMAEECLEIADEKVMASKFAHIKIEQKKVRISTREWLMEKLSPKKYGKALNNKLQGPDGEQLEMDLNIRAIEVRFSND